MSVTVSVNNTTYTIPQEGETGWADNVTSWIQAISASTLQLNGGNFTLTADVDFGANFGLKSTYYKSRNASLSTSGVFRMAVSESVGWRNNAGNGNLLLLPNASDLLQFNSIALVNISTSQVITNKDLSTGNAINDATYFYSSGDSTKRCLFQNSGATTGTTLTISNSQANNVTIAIPNLAGSNDNFTVNNVAQTLTLKTFGDALTNTQISAPSSPTAGSRRFYAKTDGYYQKDSAGTETKFAAVSASRASVIGDSPVAGASGHGTTATKIRRWTNSATTGTDLTYADSATAGMTVTVNSTGLYALSYTDSYSGGDSTSGWSVNSAQLTTSVFSITTANRLLAVIAGSGEVAATTVVALLTAGDVVRTHDNGNNDSTAAYAQFRVIKIND